MIEKPKHILLVTSEFPPQPGGIGTQAFHLADALVKEGYKVTVVSDNQSKTGEEEIKFDNALAFSVHRIKRQSIRTLMYFNRVFKVFLLMKSNNYIIASGKFSLWNVAFCNLFRKQFSLAIVHGTEVNLRKGISSKLVDKALKQFDKVVAVSSFTKQLMLHLNIDVDVISNGILLAEWENINERIVGLKGNPRLITVGRISERKGQKEVVKLLPGLLKAYPDIHYHCVGIDNDSDDVKSIAKQLDVNNYVTFHGVLERCKLKNYLAQCDIFIMLSSLGLKGDVEGFGIAILEANAMGVPAIGAYGSGVENAILEQHSGGLIKIGDLAGLKKLMNDILINKDRYKSGAEKWAKNHDWSLVVKKYISLFP